uniref:Uncharacterized protein n=1 Tax=Anguilla anguilla TaxID=7936 RepID=A0A0E9UVM1_ANGAN
MHRTWHSHFKSSLILMFLF